MKSKRNNQNKTMKYNRNNDIRQDQSDIIVADLQPNTPQARRTGTCQLGPMGLLVWFLASGSVLAQTPTVRFETKDGVGAKIFADGVPLLLDDAGAGFYLIGSDDDTDDGNNIASFVRGNNGVMRPMNGAKQPFIPYTFTLRPDSASRNKLLFNISVGPAPFNFTSISMPLDGRLQHFTHFRHANSGAQLFRYDQNPYTYTPPGGGPIYISFVGGNVGWGEMVGPDYSVRITRTKASRPDAGLAFVNAPSLSSGVRNVEFTFGSLKKGASASASGYIEVFRTSPTILPKPTWVFETEKSPYHQVGRTQADGWSVRVGDTANRFMCYGPYVKDILPGKRAAAFRLMIDNVTADNRRVLTLDIYDAASGRTLASRSLSRRDFSKANVYQEWNLEFEAKPGQTLEFRTYWHGYSGVRQDKVTVR